MSDTLHDTRPFAPPAPARRPALGGDGFASPRIAVLIPCYNEEVAIPRVVAAFRAALPQATIYVYDNNSRDGTREAALAAGAVVRTETLQGKGHVVRRMFADIEADAYLLVDGDDTYDASAGPEMVRQLWKTGWTWSRASASRTRPPPTARGTASAMPC
jgi:glycosyltransferase involved in cell wall biosynthesis